MSLKSRDYASVCLLLLQASDTEVVRCLQAASVRIGDCTDGGVEALIRLMKRTQVHQEEPIMEKTRVSLREWQVTQKR